MPIHLCLCWTWACPDCQHKNYEEPPTEPLQIPDAPPGVEGDFMLQPESVLCRGCLALWEVHDADKPYD